MRILTGLAAVAGLVLFVLAGVLVEAHLEIRSIEPELPGLRDVARLTPRADGPTRLRYLNTAVQPLAAGRMAHPVFVAEWADGRRLLIDAGMDRAGAEAFGALLETLLGAGPIEPLGPAAEQLGEALESVAGIAFTHLHTDHTGGLAALCRGRRSALPVLQTSWQAERGNYTTRAGRATLADAACRRSERIGSEPLAPLPGFPGVFAIAAAGHTPGSTIYVVSTPGQVFLLAGDVTNELSALLENREKGVVYSYLVVPESTARLERLRRWLAELHARDGVTVVVSHDLDALEQSGLPAWVAGS